MVVVPGEVPEVRYSGERYRCGASSLSSWRWKRVAARA